MIPIDQISESSMSYGSVQNSSGAAKFIVPFFLPSVDSEMDLEKPKSHNFTLKSSSNNMFSGLISPCENPSE